MADKPKIKIKLKAFVGDLRKGFSDQILMEKYGLSQSMLATAIKKVVSAGHISEEELAARNMLDSTQKVADLFSFPFGSEGSD